MHTAIPYRICANLPVHVLKHKKELLSGKGQSQTAPATYSPQDSGDKLRCLETVRARMLFFP